MKKIFLSIGLLCFGLGLFAQKLYDPKVIQRIEIKFPTDNWDAIMDANAALATDPYTIALWVKINGVKYDSVGVKFKGNSSYKAANAKNPLHIALDEVMSNQAYNGVTDLKLATGFSDASFVREALGYRILSDYMDCSRTNFANVYINGKKYGFFSNVESVGKIFISSHFDSKDGTLVKCTPPQGAGPGAGSVGYCSLKYLGADSALYKTKYDLKSKYGYKELIGLCDTVTNKSAALDQIMDVNRSIWMLAFNNLFVNLDSYSGFFAQNYYLYRDKTRRFLPVVWDLNMSFGAFTMSGSGTIQGNAILTPWLHETNADRPLIKNILANPSYKKMYVAHIKTMMDDWLVNGNYLTEGNALQAIADTAYNADPNKLYTYANFKAAMTTNITGGGGPGGPGGGGNLPGIKPLIEARLAYLKTVPEFTKIAPAISDIKNTTATIGQPVTITATIKDATTAVFKYRQKYLDRFEFINMYDDGLHNDGAANDGVWGVTFAPKVPEYQYYIYAENADAGMFSPRQAEHTFYTLAVKSTNSIAVGNLIVNEIMANNKSTILSPSGKFSDWIELYNPSANDIDLTFVSISDNFKTPKKWSFASGAKIKSKGYLIVWADGGDLGAGYHASFKFTDAGEEFILNDPNGVVLDSLTYANQKSDLSLSRCPNGGQKWVITKPTFSVSNGNCVSPNNDVIVLDNLQFYPNPVSDVLTIVNENNDIGNIQLFDLTGKMVMQQYFDVNQAQINIQDLPKGMYLLKAEQSRVVKIVKE
jgi:hypothetical protein